MVNYQQIYSHHAGDYDRLIQREDYQGNIFPALNEIVWFEGTDVVELGAGTGRLTAMLAPVTRSIRAFDSSAPMLSVAERKLQAIGLRNWSLQVAFNHELPVESGSADITIAGWTFGHAISWNEANWREEISAGLAEMARILRPGGTAIILETMGTGFLEPSPPTARLAGYYTWLEREFGFVETVIPTDYRFASLDEAVELSRFFFGEELAQRVLQENWVIVPEWTGIWYLKT